MGAERFFSASTHGSGPVRTPSKTSAQVVCRSRCAMRANWRAKAVGGRPSRWRNSRTRWAWSAKPCAAASSAQRAASGLDGSSAARAQRRRRQMRASSLGETPTAAVKRRRNCRGDRARLLGELGDAQLATGRHDPPRGGDHRRVERPRGRQERPQRPVERIGSRRRRLRRARARRISPAPGELRELVRPEPPGR